MATPEKSDLVCATPKCIDAIIKWGAHYHSVYPGQGNWKNESIIANCNRCGGGWNGKEWIHACHMCGVAVEPGALKGFFVPHRCDECDKKVVAADKAAGRICGRCKTVFSYCCC